MKPFCPGEINKLDHRCQNICPKLYRHIAKIRCFAGHACPTRSERTSPVLVLSSFLSSFVPCFDLTEMKITTLNSFTRRSGFTGSFFVLTLVLATSSLLAQDLEDKRQLEHEDYAIWNTLRGQNMSNDGKWISYLVVPGDRRRHVENTGGGF